MGVSNMPKNLRRIFLFGFITIPALTFANNGPSPQLAVLEIMVIPVIGLFMLIGGTYLVKQKKKRMNLLGGLAVILMIFFSAAHNGLALLVVIIFSVMALYNAIRMLTWGIIAAFSKKRPEHLEKASGIRLVIAGALLTYLGVIFILGSLALARWDPFRSHARLRSLKGFVEFQIAYSKYPDNIDGRFMDINKKNADELAEKALIPPDSGLFLRRDSTEIVYSEGFKDFKVTMIPQNPFPVFPLNLIFKQSSYYADQTGVIRRILVSAPKAVCPPDAEIFWEITSEQLESMTHFIGGRAYDIFYSTGTVK